MPESRRRPARSTRRTRPTAAAPAAGVVAAVSAAALGLLTITVVVLVGWAAATHTSVGAGDAVRTAVQTWLLAHHGGLALRAGYLGLVPLGLAAVPAVLLASAAGRAARTVRAQTVRGLVPLYVALVVTYAMVPVVLAPLADTDGVRPVVSQAFLGALVLALLAGGWGIARGARLRELLRERVSPTVRAVAAAATAATAVLLGAGALLVGLSLAGHFGRAAELTRALDPGLVGGAVLLLLGAALVPNAAVWGAAYAVGPGFAIGAGTTVGPFAVHLGGVPALPLLAALPSDSAAPAVALPVLLVPFAAGVVAGLLVVRRLRALPERRQVGWAAAAGGLTGLVLGLLAALSGGPVGAGSMATVGPSPWQVGLLAGLEVALAAALTAWALPPRLRARVAGTSAGAPSTARAGER